MMAVFPSAVDAVACAVRMQQTVDDHNQQHHELVPLRVRVGLHIGEPIRGDDDYFGTPVVVAQRLCDSASGGQILASELLRNLVGTRGGYSFRKTGLGELRGMGDPVTAYELAWEPSQAKRLPLPPVLTAGERTAFVGREESLKLLGDHWRLALEGKRPLVFISGEPGVGKTRLAAEFAVSVHKEGATVLYGHSDEEPLVPYQPMVEALRHHVAVEPLDRLRAQVMPIPLIRKVLPELAQRVPDLPELPSADLDTERYLLFEAVVSFLREISRVAPLLLVLEDLHWADKPTLLLLRHIARSGDQARIMVICTYRETEVFRADPLSETLADLRRDRLFDRFQLQGLDEEEVGALVNAWAGHDGRPAFVRAVYSQTEGNPFFVEEVLQHLAESGAIYRKDGMWTSDLTIDEMAIPEGVRETIGRRIRRLSEPTYRMLLIASVIGRRFQLEVLERLTDLGGDTLLEALEEAVVAGIVSEASEGARRYYYFHALFREALHEELTPTRRARLHRDIGGVLEELHLDDPDPPLGELAYHFFEARELGEVEKAVDYARRAGELALTQLASEEAVAHYRRALWAIDLDSTASPGDRSELLLALGDAQQRSGESADARETFQGAADLARELGDGKRLALAALGHAGIGWQDYGVVDEAQIRLLEEALAFLPEGDDALEARILARLAYVTYFAGTPERTASLSADAVSLARRTGDIRALGAALDARHWSLWSPDHLDERLEIANEMVTKGEEANDRDLLFLGRTWRVTDSWELGDLAAVDYERGLHSQLADDLKQPYYVWLSKSQQVAKALFDGRFAEAEQRADEAWSMGQRVSDSDALQAYATHMFILRSEQGKLEYLVDELEEIAQRFAAVPAWRAGLAYAFARLGREDDARREFDRLATDDFGGIPRDANYLGTLRLLGLVCESMQDGRGAERLYEHMAPFAKRYLVAGAAVGCFGMVAHCLGLLAATMFSWDKASRHLEEALDSYRKTGARPWLAHAQFAYSDVLRRRALPGDQERSEAFVAACLQTARELGMDALLSRAQVAAR